MAVSSLMIISESQAATALISFAPDATYVGGPGEAVDQVNGAIFGNATGAPISFDTISGPTTSFGPLVLSESGITQSFNVEIILSSNNTTAALPIQRGGVGSVGIGNTLIDVGEVLTIGTLLLTTTDGSASLFQFDGYTEVFVGNTVDGEIAILNGVNFDAPATQTSGTLDGLNAAFTASIASADTITFGSASGNASFSGVTAEFSLIPEPSSLALLGLGTLGFIIRRRRN